MAEKGVEHTGDACRKPGRGQRSFAETRYAAKSLDKELRVEARLEASASDADDMLRRGIEIRYVVTSLPGSDAEHIYETINAPWASREPRRAAQGTTGV